MTFKDGVEHMNLGHCQYSKIDALNRLTYFGDWKVGRKEGQGKLTWKDGMYTLVDSRPTPGRDGEPTYGLMVPLMRVNG